jgi:hypothetical protein
MARVRKREAVKRDLIAQWLWYAETASVEVADRFLQAADATLDLLSTQPEREAYSSFANWSCKGCGGYLIPVDSRRSFSFTSH